MSERRPTEEVPEPDDARGDYEPPRADDVSADEPSVTATGTS